MILQQGSRGLKKEKNNDQTISKNWEMVAKLLLDAENKNKGWKVTK